MKGLPCGCPCRVSWTLSPQGKEAKPSAQSLRVPALHKPGSELKPVGEVGWCLGFPAQILDRTWALAALGFLGHPGRACGVWCH